MALCVAVVAMLASLLHWHLSGLAMAMRKMPPKKGCSGGSVQDSFLGPAGDGSGRLFGADTGRAGKGLTERML